MLMLWQMYPLLLLQVINGSTGCSVSCACRWKNGKQTIECENKSLIEIPDGLDPETQVLDFSDNKLLELPRDLFITKKLINLQRVYLSNCKIKSVHQNTFRGLTNLVELDLSGNFLENVPSSSFTACPSLMKLTMSANPITSIKRSAFASLTQLNNLELSNCKISDIEEGAFSGLHSLEWLHLDNNQLTTIPGSRTLPDYVKGIDLEKNFWECDCHMMDLAVWLREFRSLLSVEPVCHGPPRLASRAIKSISETELACLPDISPTSFYLELGEGKNVSLSCHVHAVPEATVSWWFQGEVLHNDTMIAPGVHLIYYIEEGNENKRSELFIYNADAGDNGTYICNADNPAGTSQSNFTIRIILKENPIVIIVSVPFEYFLYAIGGFSILGVLVLIAVVIMIMKCRRQKRRKKKLNQTEEMVMQYQQNGSKIGEEVKSLSNSLKQRDNPTVSREANLPTYELQASCGVASSDVLSPARRPNQIKSPVSLLRVQSEQNPDIINGCRREGDGEDQRNQEMCLGEYVKAVQFPQARLRDGAELLEGEERCTMDIEGYPVDYGLPRLHRRTPLTCEGYYRTLPSNRLKRNSAANPFRRVSREAEFLSRSVDSPYENQVDVRYTADGYPVRNTTIPGPSHVVENCLEVISPLPQCSGQWPACVPANFHVINPNHMIQLDPKLGTHPGPGLNYEDHIKGSLSFIQRQGLSKRSASAQTENDSDGCSSSGIPQFIAMDASESHNANMEVNEVLTESPDEGYGGEPSVV